MGSHAATQPSQTQQTQAQRQKAGPAHWLSPIPQSCPQQNQSPRQQNQSPPAQSPSCQILNPVRGRPVLEKE
eukprot:1681352-Prymnesium_polylepis.1